MTTTAVGTTPTTLYTTGAAAAVPKQAMDKEMFLTLLVAQLRNQDPSSPMDTTQMMAQSTQLASMEQLSTLADTGRESFALQMRVAAGGLVGQEVSFLDADGVAHTGTVSGVDFTKAVPAITVGEWTVPLDAVSAVRSAPQATTPTTPTTPTTTTPAA
jgi:flagellar basal-body rod modification protein FlgD